MIHQQQPPLVLLVAQNPALAERILSELLDAGYYVRLAFSFAEIPEVLESDVPDVFLLDQHLLNDET